MAIAAIFVTWPTGPEPLELPANVREHFENLETIDFCTIDPYDAVRDHGFGKIGQWCVLDRRQGVATGRLLPNLRSSESGALCFIPRHAIQDPNDPGNYLLVCFECRWLHWQLNGESKRISIGQRGRAAFDALAVELGMNMPSEAQ
jgi:hypothetical protein